MEQQQQQQEQDQQDDEGQQVQQRPNNTTRNLPEWYPHWKGKPIYDGNQEVLAWTMCSVAESIQFVGSGAFFVNTVLILALTANGCHKKLEMSGIVDREIATEQCGPTFGSIDAKSLIALYATIIGLLTSSFLPLTGAVIDYTPHRRLIGRISAALFVFFQIPTIFLNENNYPGILCMHGVAMFFGWIQMSMLMAYLPELTDSEIKLASYTKSITIWSFFGMIIYLGFNVILVKIIGYQENIVLVSSIGMGTAFIINAIFFPIAWGILFDKREPLHERPMEIRDDGNGREIEVPSKSLFVIGFTQLWETAQKIYRNYRSLKWFYISIAFSEAAGGAFSVTAITYMATVLNITSIWTAVGLCIWLLGSIPGAFFSTLVARRTDPVKSTIVYFVLIMINVLLFSLVTEEGKLGKTYGILFLMGISGGWKNNMDRLVSSSIIPKGQDGEMMGFYLFAGQSLSWLPLIVNIAMIESGIQAKFGMVTLDIYFALALVTFLMIGSYPDARQQVRRGTVYGSSQRSGGNNNGEEQQGDDGNLIDNARRAAQEGIQDSIVTQDLFLNPQEGNDAFFLNPQEGSIDDNSNIADEKKEKFSKDVRDSQQTTATAVVDDYSSDISV